MRFRVGLIADPGSSIANKTGAWRTSRPVFLHKTCNACKLCDLCCPEGIVFGEGKVYSFDLDYCKGCGICAEVCPVADIIMVPEGA